MSLPLAPRTLAAGALTLATLAALALWSPARPNEQHAQARHFASNANFDANGAFAPARAGFDIADVSERKQLDRLPDGVEGLIWVGACAGADENFKAKVDAVIDHPKLYGFYLVDDPDPTGRWRPLCRGDSLKAETDYIHAKRPEAMTFIALMNLGSSAAPAFSPDYAPERTGVDLYGVAPYPCRAGWTACDYAMIDRFVAAALASGIPLERVAPTYQTFGSGSWKSDAGGAYRMPSAEELRAMLARWDALAPTPKLDTPIRGDASASTSRSRPRRNYRRCFPRGNSPKPPPPPSLSGRSSAKRRLTAPRDDDGARRPKGSRRCRFRTAT